MKNMIWMFPTICFFACAFFLKIIHPNIDMQMVAEIVILIYLGVILKEVDDIKSNNGGLKTKKEKAK